MIAKNYIEFRFRLFWDTLYFRKPYCSCSEKRIEFCKIWLIMSYVMQILEILTRLVYFSLSFPLTVWSKCGVDDSKLRRSVMLSLEHHFECANQHSPQLNNHRDTGKHRVIIFNPGQGRRQGVCWGGGGGGTPTKKKYRKSWGGGFAPLSPPPWRRHWPWTIMRVGWKVHRLTKKELCHINEAWHALNLSFPDTNCIVFFPDRPALGK